MAEAFDPYRKWLGILPKDQPPHHYRLLGIELFESDADVIEGAADRQMAHLRTFQAGPNSAHSQKLLNECAAARITLLDAKKRAEYDRQLREKLAQAPSNQAGSGAYSSPLAPREGAYPSAAGNPPHPQPQPIAMPQPAMPFAHPVSPAAPVIVDDRVGSAIHRRTARKTPVWRQPAVLGTAGALAIFAAIAFALTRGGKSPEVANTKPETRLPGDSSSTPANTASNPSARPVDPSPAVPTATPAELQPPVQTAPPAAADFEILEASWGNGDKWVNVTDALRHLVKDNRLMTEARNDAFVIENPALGEPKRLRLRYRARGVKFDVQYPETSFVYLDGNPLAPPSESPSQLELLEALDGGSNKYRDVLPRMREHLRNGRLLINADEFATDSGDHVLWVRYRDASGEHFTYAWGANLLALSSRLPPTAAVPVDLLQLIQVPRDAVAGDWSMRDGHLLAPAQRAARLEIPFNVPDNYALHVVAQADGLLANVDAGLVVNGRQTLVSIDAGGNYSGMALINGLWHGDDKNPTKTRLAHALEQGRPNALTFIVRPTSVRVLRDSAEILRWSGDARTFSIPRDMQVRDPRHLYLQSYDLPFRVTKLELVPLRPERAPMLVLGESGSPVDVLAAVDLERDRLHGNWQYDGKSLISPASDVGKLQLPAIVPRDYQLDVVAQRESGNDCLNLTLPIAGSQGALLIDGYQGKLSGLQAIDGKNVDSNETKYEGSIFGDGQPHAIHAIVRKNHVRLVCDGKPLVDWTGDVSRLKPPEPLPYDDRIYLGNWHSRYRLTQIKLRPLRGDAAEQTSPLADSSSTPPAMPSAAPERPATDLLKQIDLKRDAVNGDWQMVDGALISPEVPYARLMLPPPPADEYRVTLECEKIQGGWGMALAAVIGGHQVMADVDGVDGSYSGLNLLDGKDQRENGTAHRGRLLVKGQGATLVYTVRRDSIQVTFNGQPIIDWQGDSSRLSMSSGHSVPDKTRLALCEYQTVCRISKLEIEPLSEPYPTKKRRNFPDWASDSGIATRATEPDSEAQREARKAVQKKYAGDRKAAKTPEQKRELAQKLAQKATSNDANTYVLLKEAIDLAEAAGEIDLARQTIDQLAKTFDVDAIALRNQSLTEIGKAASAKSPERAWRLTDAACRLMTASLAAGDATAVKKAAAQAQSFSKRTNDKTIQKEVNNRAADAGKWAAELEDVAKARETLKSSPDDPAANLTLGRYELCVAGDLEAALAKLAKGSDAGWKKLADDELALLNRQPTGPRSFVNGRLVTRSEPADARRELAVADAWWSRAEEEPWPATHVLQMRAAKWYSSAYHSLVDTGRTRAADRLKTLLATDDGFPHWELFNRQGLQQAAPSDEVLQLDSRGGLETTVEYGGPIDVTLILRTTGTEVRLGSHNWSWNWNFKVLPNQWHTVRFIVNPVLRSAMVDGVLVHSETSQTPRKLGTAPVSIRPWNDEVIEVRKFIVKGT